MVRDFSFHIGVNSLSVRVSDLLKNVLTINNVKLFVDKNGQAAFLLNKTNSLYSIKLDPVVCPWTRASCLSLNKGKLFVPQYGQAGCPAIMASCLSHKQDQLFVPQIMTSCLFLQWSQLFIPLYGQTGCPPRQASCVTKLFVPRYGQVICPPRRASYLSLNKAQLFVPQYGQADCPLIKTNCSFFNMHGESACEQNQSYCRAMSFNTIILFLKHIITELFLQ